MADVAFSCREAKMASNIIVFEVDSLFSDFGRFVIVGFFVDPPAVGLVFTVEISQVIAMLGTGQKADNQKNEDDGCRDEPAFGNERSHDGTIPLALSVTHYLRLFCRKLNPFIPTHRQVENRSSGRSSTPTHRFSVSVLGFDPDDGVSASLRQAAGNALAIADQIRQLGRPSWRTCLLCPEATAIYLTFFRKALMMPEGCCRSENICTNAKRSSDSLTIESDRHP
ncbi:hypothetical protein [Desulfosarcina sp.]|uniref:hypothetical protein n=1 Tax=Desulfosarcina sp. TaxID=2027861 RepID=UPI003562A8C8